MYNTLITKLELQKVKTTFFHPFGTINYFFILFQKFQLTTG